MRKQNKEIQANCINDQKASPSITSKLNLNLLKYETHIINRMNENNGLFILAQGLRILDCIRGFLLQFVGEKGVSALIYLLDFTEEDISYLQLSGIPVTIPNYSEVNSTNRADFQGGIFGVSILTLIFHFTMHRVSPSSVSGIILKNPKHSITKYSPISYLLHLYRSDNQRGFIKCLMDQTFKIEVNNQIERVMGHLFIPKLFLYPRNSPLVQRDLDTPLRIQFYKHDLVQTSSMICLQDKLLKLMLISLSEIQRISKSLNLESRIFDLSQALTRNYMRYIEKQYKIKSQMIPIKIKHIAQDIFWIRKLMMNLNSYDALSFHDSLCTITKNGNIFSIFTYADRETELIISQLKETSFSRIFNIVKKTSKEIEEEGKIHESKAKREKREIFCAINPRLEGIDTEYKLNVIFEAPQKLKVIQQILENFPISRDNKIEKRKEFDNLSEKINIPLEDSNNRPTNKTILILTKYEKMRSEIEAYLISEYIIKHFAQKYEFQKLWIYLLAHDRSDRYQRLTVKSQASKEDLLRAFLLELHSAEIETEINTHYEQTLYKLQEKRNFSAYDIEEKASKIESLLDIKLHEKEISPEIEEEYFNLESGIVYNEFGVIEGLQVGIGAYQVGNNAHIQQLLSHYDPDEIILVEFELGIYRAIETYLAANEVRVTLHSLSYPHSVEGEIERSLINHEKLLFHRFITAYAQQEKVIVDPRLEIEIARDKLNMGTLNVGSSPGIYKISHISELQQIIGVDVREYHSSLPIYLYHAGYIAIPLTLSVGDYILTEDICIERKAVHTRDIVSSFKSGRLLAQIQNMHKYYKIPILLIEYDDSIEFSLQLPGAYPSQIIAKLTLLTSNFPKLRIIWSRNPMHTAKIFSKLRRGKMNPNLVEAVNKGKISAKFTKHRVGGQANLDNYFQFTQTAETEERSRTLPLEVLAQINGVNKSNIGSLIARFKNIYSLNNCPKGKLMDLIGQRDAEDIYKTLHSTVQIDEKEQINNRSVIGHQRERKGQTI